MDITAHHEEHDSPDKFQAEWDKFKMWDLVMKNDELIQRPYSMASYPAEGREIMLTVRVATPPWGTAKHDWMAVSLGIAASYIYNCKPVDKVTISGPFAEFFSHDSDEQML